MSGLEEINRNREALRINQAMLKINNHNIGENHTLRQLLSIKQVATILGDDDKPLDESTIRNYCRTSYEQANGFKLERYKFGGKVFFHADQLIDFIEKCSGRKLPYSK